VLNIVTRLKPFVFESFQLPGVVAYISGELQAYRSGNRGFEHKNE
jgi:hypothetical protein